MILVYQSALPIGFAARFLSLVKRAPYVLDLVDLWPESVAASGMLSNRFASWLIRCGAKFVYRGAKRINVITEGYRDNLLRLGVPAKKLSVIHCWPASGLFDPVPRDEQLAHDEGFENRFTIFYAGQIGPCQDLRTVLDAAELLKDLPHVQFLLAGDGVEQLLLAQQVKQRGLTNVRMLGRRSAADVQKMYALADLLLVHLKPNAMSRVSIPSKTFAYMASGRPLLMAVEGESSRLVREHRCGVTAVPSNPQDMAQAIRGFCKLPESKRLDMAGAARKAYETNYCSDMQIDKVVATLTKASAPRPGGARLNRFYRSYGKRALDIAVAAPLLLVLSPLVLLTAVVVRIKLGAPVLFTQWRPGLNGQPFAMHKFRTMTNAHNVRGELLTDAERLTPFGRWLRSTSLDELPELWDVLTGRMSLVGPRPLLEQYLPLYSPRQARRHETRSGVTGLAQVNGRNATSWDERFEHDVRYVERCSLWLDLKILAQTVGCVLRRRGVSAEEHATMPPFQGSLPGGQQRAQAA